MKPGDTVVFTNDFLAALAIREGGEIRISHEELTAAPTGVRITHGGRGTDYVITAVDIKKLIRREGTNTP